MKPQRGLSFQALEARALLTAADGPWPDPNSLTLSFAPDGTQVGLFTSNLFETLGRKRAGAVWQSEVLRAFQTWAAVADVDIGLVPDTGRPFGAAGLTQGDPRFGDIRIGAFPQSRAIANAVPFRGVSGSWSGDVFLNSSLSSGLQSANIDLFSVLLNEAGNALGLADNTDPTSVMYTDYHGERTSLSSGDIASLQSLYGERASDAYDSASRNDTAEMATLVASTTTDGTLTVVIDANLDSLDDIDYYRIPAGMAGRPISVRLIAAGSSLLVAAVDALQLYDEPIASAAAGNPMANNVHLTIPAVPVNGDVLLSVDGKANDAFGVGKYRLEISTRTGDSSAATDTSEPSGTVSKPASTGIGQARSYPALVGFIDDEMVQNDSLATATALESPFGYAAQTRYEAIGAIRSAGDVDVYRITAPEVGKHRLAVNLDTFDVRLADFRIELYDEAGNSLMQQVAAQADGRIVLELPDAANDAAYFLSISAGGPGGSSLANYVVTADFIRETSNLTPIGSGLLSTPEQQDVLLKHVTRTLLYRFDLQATGNSTGGVVWLEIRDGQGEVIARQSAAVGTSSSQLVWLHEGSYEFVLWPDEGVASGGLPLAYTLFAAALSDDVGPGLVDPTESLLPGDADRSGVVDRGDMAAVAADFGTFAESLPSLADFDGDGDVDLTDLLTVAANFGRALLPDLSTPTSTGGPSSTGTLAPSAIVATPNASEGIETLAANGTPTSRRSEKQASRNPVEDSPSRRRRPTSVLADIAMSEHSECSSRSQLRAIRSARIAHSIQPW